MSDFDPADFVDDDFQTRKSPPSAGSGTTGAPLRSPSLEEVDAQLVKTQQKLAELQRDKEQREREKASLEETRRRQIEFQTGRQEMVDNLTRGLGLLEEAELKERREAEQMARALTAFRDALSKIQSIQEESWNGDNYSMELTRALTSIENARMEWNTARVKFPVLFDGASGEGPSAATEQSPFSNRSFIEHCKLGFALTWPLTLVALAGLIALLVILFRN